MRKSKIFKSVRVFPAMIIDNNYQQSKITQEQLGINNTFQLPLISHVWRRVRKKWNIEKKQHRSPTLDRARGSGLSSHHRPTAPCESLSACVPHQLLGLPPNPLMRLDPNDDGRGVKYHFTWRWKPQACSLRERKTQRGRVMHVACASSQNKAATTKWSS